MNNDAAGFFFAGTRTGERVSSAGIVCLFVGLAGLGGDDAKSKAEVDGAGGLATLTAWEGAVEGCFGSGGFGVTGTLLTTTRDPDCAALAVDVDGGSILAAALAELGTIRCF